MTTHYGRPQGSALTPWYDSNGKQQTSTPFVNTWYSEKAFTPYTVTQKQITPMVFHNVPIVYSPQPTPQTFIQYETLIISAMCSTPCGALDSSILPGMKTVYQKYHVDLLTRPAINLFMTHAESDRLLCYIKILDPDYIFHNWTQIIHRLLQLFVKWGDPK